MDPYSTDVVWIVVFAFIVAFILACGLGANDVSNSFGTSVGSKVLTVRQACMIATVAEIAGAVLIGYKVTDTMRKGILNVDVYVGAEVEFMLGMTSVLIGASIWLILATFLKLPVSTTHSVVGATIGFSLVCRLDEGLNWESFGLIVGSWFVSPLLSGIISVLLYTIVRYLVLNAEDPIARGLICLPVFYGVTMLINVFTVVHDGSTLLYFDRIPLWGTFVACIGAGLLTAVIVHFIFVPMMKKKLAAVGSTDGTMDVVKRESYTEHTETDKGVTTMANGRTSDPVVEQVPAGDVTSSGHDNPAFTYSSNDITDNGTIEKKKDLKNKIQGETVLERRIYVLFSFLQTMTATFASFVHGGNDVSNAIGPMIAIWLSYTEGNVRQKAETPIYLLFYGGVGISVGLWVWGSRVMKTVGEKLTSITSSTGFTIELGAAFTVLLATKIGVPVSTTHCLIGSVVCVGWASQSKEGVDWRLFRNIALAWLVTVPVSGLISAAAVALLRVIVL